MNAVEKVVYRDFLKKRKSIPNLPNPLLIEVEVPALTGIQLCLYSGHRTLSEGKEFTLSLFSSDKCFVLGNGPIMKGTVRKIHNPEYPQVLKILDLLFMTNEIVRNFSGEHSELIQKQFKDGKFDFSPPEVLSFTRP